MGSWMLPDVAQLSKLRRSAPRLRRGREMDCCRIKAALLERLLHSYLNSTCLYMLRTRDRSPSSCLAVLLDCAGRVLRLKVKGTHRPGLLWHAPQLSATPKPGTVVPTRSARAPKQLAARAQANCSASAHQRPGDLEITPKLAAPQKPQRLHALSAAAHHPRPPPQSRESNKVRQSSSPPL